VKDHIEDLTYFGALNRFVQQGNDDRGRGRGGRD